MITWAYAASQRQQQKTTSGLSPGPLQIVQIFTIILSTDTDWTAHNCCDWPALQTVSYIIQVLSVITTVQDHKRGNGIVIAMKY